MGGTRQIRIGRLETVLAKLTVTATSYTILAEKHPQIGESLLGEASGIRTAITMIRAELDMMGEGEGQE